MGKRISSVFIRQVIISSLLMVGAGILFKLDNICICILLLSAFFISLLLTKFIHKENHERDRFYEALTYMEQMIYSFMKFPKIREALLDVSQISTGILKKTIHNSLNHIDKGNDINIFKKALEKMEAEYDCRHIKFLHKYLIKLETEGGNYEVFLNLMLEDMKSWSNAVVNYRQEIKQKKRNLLIGIVITVITSGIMVRMVPDNFDYTGVFIYKILFTGFLIVLYMSYLFIAILASSSWLEAYHEFKTDRVNRLDNLITVGIKKKYSVLSNAIGIVLIIFAMILTIQNSDFRIVIIIISVGIYIMLKPVLVLKKAKKKMTREIRKTYSDWLLSFAMNLQSQTVQTALYNSYYSASNVLKPELKRVLKEMTANPVSIKPYDCFLKNYELKDIKSSFRMLYPLQTMNQEQITDHLLTMMNRSRIISSKAFELQQEDRLSLFNLSVSAPSFIGVFMIMTSIFLLVSNFSNVLNKSLEGITKFI